MAAINRSPRRMQTFLKTWVSKSLISAECLPFFAKCNYGPLALAILFRKFMFECQDLQLLSWIFKLCRVVLLVAAFTLGSSAVSNLLNFYSSLIITPITIILVELGNDDKA